MAKQRHRIFEMYEFRDEAISALSPKPPATAERDTPLGSFQQLTVTLSGGLIHVQFKDARNLNDDSASELREDFDRLAGELVRSSKVLLDFEGVGSFGAASINALVLFMKKLQNKGSRIVLCCLDPVARESFFVPSQ